MTKAEDDMRQENACARWPVLVACFMCHMAVVSVSYHAGVLHVALMDEFGEDVVTTAWLGALYSSLPSLVGPLASLVITTFDCRTCLIASGFLAAAGSASCFFITRFAYLYPALILAGTGQGFSNVATYVAIGYNFPRQANILTGICVCGSGLGIFIHPPLLQYLVNTVGFQGAMLVIGAISLNAIPCGLACSPSSFEKQRRLDRKQRRQNTETSSCSKRFTATMLSHVELLTDFRFLLFLVTGLGFSSALACYYLYLPSFLLVNRYDSMTASFVLSATGMGSIPSRLLTGGATNSDEIDSLTFFFGIHAMAAITTLAVPFAVDSVVAQMVLGGLFGVYTGAAWAAYSPLLLDLLGIRRVADGVGMYLFTMGVGYVAGPPLAGIVYSSSNNFRHVFYLTAASFGLASGAGMLTALVKPKDEAIMSKLTFSSNADIDIVEESATGASATRKQKQQEEVEPGDYASLSSAHKGVTITIADVYDSSSSINSSSRRRRGISFGSSGSLASCGGHNQNNNKRSAMLASSIDVEDEGEREALVSHGRPSETTVSSSSLNLGEFEERETERGRGKDEGRDSVDVEMGTLSCNGCSSLGGEDVGVVVV